MSLEAWQIALRREFGRAQRFRLQNIGAEPVFSEFTVSNPQTGGSYRVAIRGRNPGDNYCSCPDFAVNTLGTCKHDDSGRVVGYRHLAQIAETLKPILLRRGKAEVLRELPERLDKLFFVPMTEAQARHHEENREIVARIVAKWRRYRFLTETDQRRLMIAPQNMRMACNSTYLLDGSRKTPDAASSSPRTPGVSD